MLDAAATSLGAPAKAAPFGGFAVNRALLRVAHYDLAERFRTTFTAILRRFGHVTCAEGEAKAAGLAARTVRRPWRNHAGLRALVHVACALLLHLGALVPTKLRFDGFGARAEGKANIAGARACGPVLPETRHAMDRAAMSVAVLLVAEP